LVVRAGKLRRRLIIQQAVETQGATGELSISWGTFATVYGAVEPLRGREFFAAKEFQAEVTTRIRIRYLVGVTPKMQILDGITVYLINAVIDPEMKHQELQLMCVEVVAT
jgi:SPP1 family predicted phage head-tail adaptor